jgi:hypothetical protein
MTPIVVVGLAFQASETEEFELVGWAEQGETIMSSARTARKINFIAPMYYGEGRPHKR